MTEEDIEALMILAFIFGGFALLVTGLVLVFGWGFTALVIGLGAFYVGISAL